MYISLSRLRINFKKVLYKGMAINGSKEKKFNFQKSFIISLNIWVRFKGYYHLWVTGYFFHFAACEILVNVSKHA
jgi:hypothetical protein